MCVIYTPGNKLFIDQSIHATKQNNAAKQNEEPQDRPLSSQRKPIYVYLYIKMNPNLQRLQIALAMMFPLEVHGAIEW